MGFFPLVYLLAIGGFAASALATGDPTLRSIAIQALAIAVLLTIVIGIGALLFIRWSSSHDMRRQLLGRICPGCGYPFAGLPPESDGCNVCPECGGAWRISPTPRKYSAPLPASALPARPELLGVRTLWHHLSTVADDRGQRWSVHQPGSAFVKRLPRGVRARRSATSASLAVIWFLTSYLATLLVISLVAYILGLEDVSSDTGGPCLMVAIGSLFAGGLWLTNRGAPAYIQQNLDDGACAICGRSLADITPHADGCTLCPDCGAAWKLPTPGEP